VDSRDIHSSFDVVLHEMVRGEPHVVDTGRTGTGSVSAMPTHSLRVVVDDRRDGILLLDQQGMEVRVIAPRKTVCGELVESCCDQPLAPPAPYPARVVTHRRQRDTPRLDGSAHVRQCHPEPVVLPGSGDFLEIGKAGRSSRTYSMSPAHRKDLS
jgi:hypothetical protein